MNNIIVYIIFFLIVFACASLGFAIFYKKYKIKPQAFITKIIFFSIVSTIIISGFGTIYSISLLCSKDKEITNISRPNIGKGDEKISLNVDSEIYSGTIDIEIQEKEMTFEEALNIFSHYREELDTCVLNGNSSFLNVNSSLCFPSNIGDENIQISWYIDRPEIIDYTGHIITENFLKDKEDVEIIATLSLKGHTAEICYFITAARSPLSPKEELSAYINESINSQLSLYKDNVDLPTDMNGMNLRYYKAKKDFPPIPFYWSNDINTNVINIFRK